MGWSPAKTFKEAKSYASETGKALSQGNIGKTAEITGKAIQKQTSSTPVLKQAGNWFGGASSTSGQFFQNPSNLGGIIGGVGKGAIGGPNGQKNSAANAPIAPKDYGPMPELGDYQSLLDGSTTLKVDPVTGKLDMSGIDEIKARALATGDSAWAKMALEKQGIEQGALLNNAARLSATEAAQNRAAMSARGGLRGGAAMRLANQAQQQGAMGRQNVFQQGALSRADIGLQDQVQKNQFLGMLPGAQLAAANYTTGIDQFNALQNNEANKFNIGNTITDRTGRNAWTQMGYQEKMKMLAANKTADAIAASGQKERPFDDYFGHKEQMGIPSWTGK